MTMLLQDMDNEIGAQHGDSPSADYIPSRSLLSADDMQGAEVNTEALQDCLDAVVTKGKLTD